MTAETVHSKIKIFKAVIDRRGINKVVDLYKENSCKNGQIFETLVGRWQVVGRDA